MGVDSTSVVSDSAQLLQQLLDVEVYYEGG